MNSRTRVTTYAAGLAAGFLGILAQTKPAQAAACADLSHPIYIAGSTAIKPFVQKVAGILASLPTPITVVYQGQGSCTGVNYLVATPTGTITGVGNNWDATGTALTDCDLTAVTGDAVDVGISDVYATSCPNVLALPAGVADFYGPIQAMTFSVPLASTKQSISAEAAYLLFGLGADGAVAPWTDMTQVMVRSASSGTQQMLSAAINVPASKWLGVSKAGSGDVLAGLVAASNADAAIGILSTDVVDKNRGKVHALAYQHYGQTCGYTPDSDATTSFDKKNVRDGHYAVWGPAHLLAKVDAQGAVADPDVKKFIDYLSLATTNAEADNVTMIDAEAKGGVVPDCAMRVKRGNTEMSAMISYMPKKSCECRFLATATGTAPSTCKACAASTECPAATPACNYGYCEVQ
jgi:ABC-type phosphate transport system substrate-binding protein